MCVYSMVADHYRDALPTRPYWPVVGPSIVPQTYTNVIAMPPVPSKEDFDALKRDVEDIKKLLTRAVEYDKRTGQPHCETEEKIAFLKKVADFVGVELPVGSLG